MVLGKGSGIWLEILEMMRSWSDFMRMLFANTKFSRLIPITVDLIPPSRPEENKQEELLMFPVALLTSMAM